MNDEERLLALARNIVNQLFDVAEVPVATRQAVNDVCDEFVFDMLWKVVEDCA